MDSAARHGTDSEPAPAAGQQVVYLGISGVLHPSRSRYLLAHSKPPSADGHLDYEAAPVLERLLSPWPRARIVLTSMKASKLGLETVLEKLGPGLSERVIGSTFDDITTRVRRGPQRQALSSDDYWRLDKCAIVRIHAAWLQPSAWVAVDAEDIGWSHSERRSHLVVVDGCRGLLDPAAQDRLLTMLQGNFGAPSP